MKRRRGEIQIFTLSAIDLFACAMAAFLIVAVALIPHYGKNSPALQTARAAEAAAKTELAQQREQTAAAKAEAAQERKSREEAQVKLGQGTMVMVMRASGDDLLGSLKNVPGLKEIDNYGYLVVDADLIVQIPDGTLIWHGYRGTRETGILGYDVPMSGGPNIFTSHNPKPGRYKVWINLQAVDERASRPFEISYSFNAIFPRKRLDIAGTLSDKQINPGISSPPNEAGRVLLVDFSLDETLDVTIHSSR